MLWLVTKSASHQIVSCNLHQEGDKHSVWVERSNGKNLKIKEDDDISVVLEIKKAIDFAISKKYSTLELDI